MGIEGAKKVTAPHTETGGVRSALEVVDTALDLFEVVKKTAKLDALFDKIPKAARAMVLAKVLLALTGSAAAEAPDQSTMQNALNTAARMYTSEQVVRGREAQQANAAQVELQFQSFLDQIQPYTRETRALFGEHPNPMQQRAIRFAFGNLFVEFDNVITKQNLSKAEKYEERLAAVLGAPVDIDDILEQEFKSFHPSVQAAKTEVFEGEQGREIRLDDLKPDGTPKQIGIDAARFTPKMSPEYAGFVKALFQIFRSAKFQELRKVVDDKGQMFALEILMHPKWATPEELAWAKETARLEHMLGLVNSDVAYKSIQ
jgi:hypothetical protein